MARGCGGIWIGSGIGESRPSWIGIGGSTRSGGWHVKAGWNILGKLAWGCVGCVDLWQISLLYLLNCCSDGDKFGLVIKGSVVGWNESEEWMITVFLFQCGWDVIGELNLGTWHCWQVSMAIIAASWWLLHWMSASYCKDHYCHIVGWVVILIWFVWDIWEGCHKASGIVVSSLVDNGIGCGRGWNPSRDFAYADLRVVFWDANATNTIFQGSQLSQGVGHCGNAVVIGGHCLWGGNIGHQNNHHHDFFWQKPMGAVHSHSTGNIFLKL